MLKNLNYLYILILLLISFTANFYYGSVGVFPIDTFAFFDSANLINHGFFPIRDYWTSNGFLVDFLQSVFFRTFGTSWYVYLFHSSLVNFLLVFFTYKFLINEGIVEVNKLTSSKFTPHELNYQNNELIDFSKGCFNGQEVIARMEYRGKLKFALKIADNLQEEIKNSLIYNKEGKKVGEVLSKEGKYGFVFFKNKDDQTESIFLDGQILNIL